MFYRRLFVVKPFLIASTIMIAIVAAWGIGFGSAMAGQCSPPDLFWRLFETEYIKHKCVNVQMLYQGLAISDLILDVFVLALPIPMVASLQLPWRTKIKVIDILMLGSVYVTCLSDNCVADKIDRVLASGIARITSFYQVVAFTNEHAEEYFKDTLCTSLNGAALTISRRFADTTFLQGTQPGLYSGSLPKTQLQS